MRNEIMWNNKKIKIIRKKSNVDIVIQDNSGFEITKNIEIIENIDNTNSSKCSVIDDVMCKKYKIKKPRVNIEEIEQKESFFQEDIESISDTFWKECNKDKKWSNFVNDITEVEERELDDLVKDMVEEENKRWNRYDIFWDIEDNITDENWNKRFVDKVKNWIVLNLDNGKEVKLKKHFTKESINKMNDNMNMNYWTKTKVRILLVDEWFITDSWNTMIIYKMQEDQNNETL